MSNDHSLSLSLSVIHSAMPTGDFTQSRGNLGYNISFWQKLPHMFKYEHLCIKTERFTIEICRPFCATY
ncbi:MAG: hypothetical protein KGY60_01560 [Bacteroidales bacterium]|nr:hypothetical protein [Bacteroidales bacterium]